MTNSCITGPAGACPVVPGVEPVTEDSGLMVDARKVAPMSGPAGSCGIVFPILVPGMVPAPSMDETGATGTIGATGG